MFAQGAEAFGMVELFVGGLAGIDVGVPEFEAINVRCHLLCRPLGAPHFS